MAIKGFAIGTKDGMTEVLTDRGRIVRVKEKLAKGLPALRPSAVRVESKQRKGTQRQVLAYDYLVHVKHWKPHQAAAMVGRLSQESGANLDPSAVGDKGTAFGIAQWRGERNVRRLKFHAKNKNDPKDLFAELDYFDYELRNFETKAFETISAARTIDEAAAGMMHFERPQGWTPATPTAGHGWDNTLKFANQIAETVPEDVPTAENPEPEIRQTFGDILGPEMFGRLTQAKDPQAMQDIFGELEAQRDTILGRMTEAGAKLRGEA